MSARRRGPVYGGVSSTSRGVSSSLAFDDGASDEDADADGFLHLRRSRVPTATATAPSRRDAFMANWASTHGGSMPHFRHDGFDPDSRSQSLPFLPSPLLMRGLKRLFLRGFAAFSVASALLAMAVSSAALVYAGVYMNLMPPSLQIEAPVFFDFDLADAGQSGLSRIALGNPRDQGVSLPAADLDLLRAGRQWVPRPGLEETTDFKADNSLAPGFLYNIGLRLYLPEADDHLRNVGNFMVSARLESRRRVELARSKRPALARSRPQPKMWRVRSWLSWATMLIPLWPIWGGEEYDPALELALKEQAFQLVDVSLFEGFRERYENDLRVRFTKLQLSNPMVQLYGAKIVFDCQLEGLAYYMYHYFYSAFAIYLFAISGTIAFGLYGVAAAFSLFTAVSSFAGDDEPKSFRAPEGEFFDYYNGSGGGLNDTVNMQPGLGDMSAPFARRYSDSSFDDMLRTPSPNVSTQRRARSPAERVRSRGRSANRQQRRSQSMQTGRARARIQEQGRRREQQTPLPSPPASPLFGETGAESLPHADS